MEPKTNVGIMPAGRDVKDEGSNNVVHRDRDTPGTNSLETTRLGYMDETDTDSESSDDLKTERLGSYSTVEFASEAAKLDNAESHAKVPSRREKRRKSQVTLRATVHATVYPTTLHLKQILLNLMEIVRQRKKRIMRDWIV